MTSGWSGLFSIWRSFAFKFFVLVLVLVAVPAVVFEEFRTADVEKTQLLQSTVQQEARLIATSLLPDLMDFQSETAGSLGTILSAVSGDGINVKLLFRPANGQEKSGFYYIASSPPSSGDYLEHDRAELLATGILDRLPESCTGGEQLGLRYVNPSGAEEILTSIFPVNLANGCWVVITSHSSDDFLSSSAGRPYWTTSEAQLAILLYLLMVLLVVSLFADIWRNLYRFGAVARAIRTRRPGDRLFRARNNIPELDRVADEFDRMVNVLGESAIAIRQSAQENLHALKAPLAVITQSIEPLRRTLPPNNGTAARALELIEHSVMRLDATVSAANRIGQATAELIDPPREPIDISALLRGMLASYQQTAEAMDLRLQIDISDDLIVRGSEDLFERTFDNLLENTFSFAPPGTAVSVACVLDQGRAKLTIGDEGPGVPAEDLEQIFERYYSRRDEKTVSQWNFGIGLWVARRNVEAVGGTIAAANRDGGGLLMTVLLPIAQPDDRAKSAAPQRPAVRHPTT